MGQCYLPRSPCYCRAPRISNVWPSDTKCQLSDFWCCTDQSCVHFPPENPKKRALKYLISPSLYKICKDARKNISSFIVFNKFMLLFCSHLLLLCRAQPLTSTETLPHVPKTLHEIVATTQPPTANIYTHTYEKNTSQTE